MSAPSRRLLGINVLEATQQRISYVFDQFERIYVSFSGGKDSTAMLHLVMAEAIKRQRHVGVLFIDWEVQYKQTIEHIAAMFERYKDNIDPYWVALPLETENAISQHAPRWTCWEHGKRDLWVRQPPAMAITDESFFDFYRYPMTFEEFVPAFGDWYATRGCPYGADYRAYVPTACFVGIRTDESFNRLLKLRVRQNRQFWCGRQWLLNLKSSHIDVVLAHPIYDWQTEDIWTFYGRTGLPYNPIYDLMYRAGVPISKQRIDEFFGFEARRGLWMLHVIEPDTWARVTGRIIGCNAGALYARNSGNINGDRKITLPPGHTWESFAKLLLNSMPTTTGEHYTNKILIYLRWYKDRGYPNGIPDEAAGDLQAKHTIPSWRRICKVLLRGDYWCKALCFTPTKQASYENYLRIMRNRRAQWGMSL